MKYVLRGLPCMILIILLASCTFLSEKPTLLQSSSSTQSTVFASEKATSIPPSITTSNRISPSPSRIITDEPEPTVSSTYTFEPKDPQNPDYTEEPHTAPDYGISDMKDVGLTNEQYEKIYTMLYAASNAGLYLKGANKLSAKDYLHFCFWALNELSYNDFYANIAIGTDYETSDCYVNLAAIQKILKSAFGIRYTSNYTGSYEDIGIYRKGDRFFFYQVEGGHYEYPFAFKMQQLPDNKIKLSMDIVTSGNFDSSFTAKAEAVIQKDSSSIFGYRLISFKKVRITEPRFTRAEASSYLPRRNGKSFVAKNVLDRKTDTFWVSAKKEDQWIKISATGIQTVTGIIVRYEDIDDNPPASATSPLTVNIEFSDGTVYQCDGFGQYVSFGRVVKTSSIKVFIISYNENNEPSLGYYIADIIPY